MSMRSTKPEVSGGLAGSRRGRRRRPGPLRSFGAAAALCASVALVASGCSSDDSGGAAQATTSRTTAAPTTTQGGTGGASDASGLSDSDQAAITSAFEDFFDGSSDADTKLANVEDPDRFADTIHAQAGMSLAQSTTVQVGAMDLVAPGRASVTYTILFDDEPVLKDQKGYAVQVDGKWKVSASSFCGLLTLENDGTPPQQCASAPGGDAQSPQSTPTS